MATYNQRRNRDHYRYIREQALRIGGHIATDWAAARVGNWARGIGLRSASGRASNVHAHRSLRGSQADDFPSSQITGISTSSHGSSAVVHSGTPVARREAVRARRILRGTRASSTRPTAMKAAMYIPGKGAEVELIHNNYLQPIQHHIPWKNDKLRYDGITSSLVNPRGNRVSMDFALKMIIECQLKGMTSPWNTDNPDGIIPTRFHCAHIFRHTNSATFSSKTGATATNTTGWHSTLGPDASYIRLTPAQGGSMAGTIPPGVTNTLLSPYRMPPPGQNMYSRIGLVALENMGWNLNPLKLTGYMQGTTGFTGVTVFGNSSISTPSSAIATSDPHNQMIVNGLDPGPSDNKFITQHGPGGVSYTFSNDGTNAVTLECVIVGFKDDANVSTASDAGIANPYATFIQSAQQAYFNRRDAKQGGQTLAGDPHTAIPSTGAANAGAIFSNAETEFIPSNIWPYIGKTNTGTSSTTTVVNPFKLLSRDQFILGGGQSRLWKTSFPSVVYDASTDSPQDTCNVNKHSIMLIWGLCSAPLPVMEGSTSTGNTEKIMLSREPQNCNVSVVGTYFETPTPVFCKKTPAPINAIGSLAQVSVSPSNAGSAFPTGSFPQLQNTTTTVGGAMLYVDLPRSGQMPFTTEAQDFLEIGTLSTAG